MNKQTLYIYHRPDNIRVHVIKDSSLATIQSWLAYALQNTHQLPEKRLIDLRHLVNLSIYAIRGTIKIKAHPQANEIYTAVLAPHARVRELVDLALRIQPGGHFCLFSDEQEAICWLNTYNPAPRFAPFIFSGAALS